MIDSYFFKRDSQLVPGWANWEFVLVSINSDPKPRYVQFPPSYFICGSIRWGNDSLPKT
ncbi:hypothetical protein OSCI_2860009 [Kamptonema sp. PCC 6506]|nr:hypothetical protein OSCI_2860009 [Kamptonema sp. PCC 6506]